MARRLAQDKAAVRSDIADLIKIHKRLSENATRSARVNKELLGLAARMIKIFSDEAFDETRKSA